MNQGKLEVVKQERARMNVNILGISELKWMGTQMTIISTTVGVDSLEKTLMLGGIRGRRRRG